jgi:Triose-phosphate Transporter family
MYIHIYRLWLFLWSANNIGVTLINKAAFSVVHFPYPYALTAIHMAVCSAACQYIFYSLPRSSSNSHHHAAGTTAAPPASPSKSKNIWVQLLGEELLQEQQQHLEGAGLIWAFSVLFSLNIALGNVSLQHVSVNFNQVMRSLVPVLTLWCSLWLNKPISAKRRLAVWPVVIGVAMACFGDRMSVTTVGFIYTFVCVLISCVKLVASSELLTGTHKLHPVRLLQLMAPAALLQCTVLSVVTGEAAAIAERWSTDLNPLSTGDWVPVSVLLFSGVLAFSLNICALQAYKLTSPLTCCIAAAVKQVLVIVVGTALFRITITPLNGAGIVVVLIGSAYYSYVSVAEQTAVETRASKDASTLTSSDEEEGVEVEEGIPLISATTVTRTSSNEPGVVARR